VQCGRYTFVMRVSLPKHRARVSLRFFAALVLSASSTAAFAHAFDERYDLPAPLSYFVFGATAAVALSFAVAAFFLRVPVAASQPRSYVFRVAWLMPVLSIVCALTSVVLLATTIAAGLFGTRDPVMNLAPTLVWIAWWVGLSFVVACVGNIWPALDPWRALFAMLDAGARAIGSRNGATIGWRYPKALGAWPAVALLLFVGWFEVVYPEGAEPRRLALAALAWTAFTLLGRVCFGNEAWQRNGDVFSIYFDTLGRFAPLASVPDERSVELRPHGRGLLSSHAASAAMIGFVVAMLAVVLFDGLLSGEVWWAAQARVMRAIPQLYDARSSTAGAVGLVSLWLMLLTGYLASCWMAASLVPGRGLRRFAGIFAFSLVPIAVGYNIAHNYSNLLVQGQHVIALLSDPLGRHWNIFGTAGYRANPRIVDARTTWHVAIAAIVAGHAISIWIAHRIALHELGTRRQATLACVPLTVLMLIYTAISLSIIAEPMTKFEPWEPQSSARAHHRCAAGHCHGAAADCAVHSSSHSGKQLTQQRSWHGSCCIPPRMQERLCH
jgi:hypothetical protein